MNERHRFQLWQHGVMVAAVDCASREYAMKEIGHYAAVYGQDGPVNIVEVKRKPGVVGSPAQCETDDGQPSEMQEWSDYDRDC